jgi:polyadenylate-binding protein 2
MKQRVEEMEREAKKLRELQAAAESSAAVEQVDGDEATPMETEDDKTAIDSRSVFVGNVRDILVPLWFPHNPLLRTGRL